MVDHGKPIKNTKRRRSIRRTIRRRSGANEWEQIWAKKKKARSWHLSPTCELFMKMSVYIACTFTWFLFTWFLFDSSFNYSSFRFDFHLDLHLLIILTCTVYVSIIVYVSVIFIYSNIIYSNIVYQIIIIIISIWNILICIQIFISQDTSTWRLSRRVWITWRAAISRLRLYCTRECLSSLGSFWFAVLGLALSLCLSSRLLPHSSPYLNYVCIQATLPRCF